MKVKKKKALLKQLAKIEDFRRHREQIVYPLHEILFLTIFGLLKGYVTFSQLHFWMTQNKDNKIFKILFKKKKIRIPSRSTLHRILSNVNYDALEIVFRATFKAYRKGENTAIDGKWMNGSDVNGQYVQQSHKSVLHILDKDVKIVLGHKFMEKGKLSEIPAFEEILNDKTFNSEGQIYTADALHTQVNSAQIINDKDEYFLFKVKNNQKLLRDKIISTINDFIKPTNTYTSPLWGTEGNKSVTRTVDIFQNSGSNIVIFHSEFRNIQTLIRITKKTTNRITGEVKATTQYLIANFKDKSAHEFHDTILQHWRVETFHYHKDMLTCEDDHICYINPFCMTILRSFAINFYQLYFNKNKDTKIVESLPTTMANIKRACHHDDKFTANIFEL